MISRRFTVFSLKRETPISGVGKDAKRGTPKYTVGLAEDSKELNHFQFDLELSEDEALSLSLGSTFTLTQNMT